MYVETVKRTVNLTTCKSPLLAHWEPIRRLPKGTEAFALLESCGACVCSRSSTLRDNVSVLTSVVNKSKNMRPDMLSRNVGKHLRTQHNIPMGGGLRRKPQSNKSYLVKTVEASIHCLFSNFLRNMYIIII
jgi:hypothetical protein